MPNWGIISPSPKPTARYELPGVFDPARDLGVIHGGNTAEGGDTRSGETWEWNGSLWVLKSGAGGYEVRGHGLAYGPGTPTTAGNKVIQFGGYGAPPLGLPAYLNTVLQYDGTSWGAATIGGGTPPSGRQDAVVGWFPGRSAYIIGGGFSGLFSLNDWFELYVNDAFSLSWRKFTDVNDPGSRKGARGVYDAYAGGSAPDFIVFGGWYNPGEGSYLQNDTWALDSSGSWTLLSPVASPPARAYHGMYYDEGLQAVVIVGGLTGIPGTWGNDTWYLDRTGATPTWVQLESTQSPPSGRGNGALWYDAKLKQAFMFGGQGSIFDETWGFITGGIDANQINLSTEIQTLDPMVADVQPVGFRG